MKKVYIFILVLMVIGNGLFSQNTSKMLRGVTMTERNAIANPVQGMQVLCGDCSKDGNATISVYNNGHWNDSPVPCCYPPTAGIHIPSATQIIWNWNYVFGADGYLWNTINDLTTAVNIGLVFSKTETGLTCNTPYIRYIWAYNVCCGQSLSTQLTESTLTCPWTCGSSLTINHVAGDVAPVTKTVIYGTVTNIPGAETKCWITSNLGADHRATSVDDATEPSAGWYWQFNRMQGYKNDGSTVTPTWTITSINENSDWQLANDPCAIELGTGWRIPTSTEWTNVNNSFVPMNDWSGEWNSALKLHAAGDLSYLDGSLYGRGSYGFYWSSVQNSTDFGQYLLFFSGYSIMIFDPKACGFSLRCLRD